MIISELEPFLCGWVGVMMMMMVCVCVCVGSWYFNAINQLM